MKKLYQQTVEEVLAAVVSGKKGLTTEEARCRLETEGKNVLQKGKRRMLWQMALEQVLNPMVLVLLGAAILSAAFGEWTDAIIIFAVVLINTVLGVFQENKSERSIEALQGLSADTCKVYRDGAVIEVPAEMLVRGDVVVLDAGEYVAADMRLIEAASLKIEEASLTGESVPVDKGVAAIDLEDTSLGDRKNLAFMGSTVTYGRGLGLVVATGMQTEMGKIAHLLSQEHKEITPLQQKIAELSKTLSIVVLVICVVMFVIGVWENGGIHGGHLFEMFMTAISLAVAAIPEGLPAVITIVLALGITRMAKKRAIVRKLHAVETLGCTQVICSDKTGTLTQNKMTVQQVYVDETLLPLVPETESPSLAMLSEILVLCNDTCEKILENGSHSLSGDPTETALMALSYRLDAAKSVWEAAWPRVGEAPFDSERKLMSTIHQLHGVSDASAYTIYVKGAPDELLTRCQSFLCCGKEIPLTEVLCQVIRLANKQMADKALRVLGGAYRRVSVLPEAHTPEALERELVFVGLVGMIDPPRPEVRDAMAECCVAGIRPVMITGDHKDTAVAIAKDLGLMQEGSKAILGSDLDKMSQSVFEETVQDYAVYARVSPEHKVKIVKAWQKQGNIVAMTGDGVNDAPALKMADIGVGMGITGTDVSKSVSDMVLADDNFSTIVAAVREGRKVYANLRKAVQFLLSSNASEVIALFVATLLNFKLLFPVHILWINLISDTFPALALGLEPEEKDIMLQKPRRAGEGFFAGGMIVSILYQGIAMACLTLLSYLLGMQYSPEVGITMAFVCLSFVQLFHAFNLRSQTHSLLYRGQAFNPMLVFASLTSILLTVIVVMTPRIHEIFRVVPLTWIQWIMVTGLAFAIIPIVEIVKVAQHFVVRRRRGQAVKQRTC